MASRHVIMIDFEVSRRRVHLIGIDDGELRHHSHVLMPHQVAVVHVRRQRVLVRRELDRQLNGLPGGQQHGVLPAQSRIRCGRTQRDDLKRHPMDMEVVRLVVGVLYGPQLGCASSDYGVDSRHLHLIDR